jgi:5-methylcytosine-specific restriction protein A
MCKAEGRITIATVADHKTRHKGDMDLFFNPLNLQSLCDEAPYRCHSSRKQGIERKGFDKAIGSDGFPIDPLHPSNR